MSLTFVDSLSDSLPKVVFMCAGHERDLCTGCSIIVEEPLFFLRYHLKWGRAEFAVNACLGRRVGMFSKRSVSFHLFHLAIRESRVMPHRGGFIREAAA